MAYLPGERPLINPWEFQEPQTERGPFIVSNALSRIAVSRGVSGKGSAYVEWGQGSTATKLIAIVRGPRQQSITRSQFEVDISFSSFIGLTDFTSSASRDLSSYVKEAIEGVINMELYPCAAISVHIKVLQCSNYIHSLIAPGIAAAVIACQEGGIALREPVVAVPLSVSPAGESVVDPDSFLNNVATATIALNAKSRTVSFLHLTGVVKSADVVDSLVNQADGAVSTLCQVLGIAQ